MVRSFFQAYKEKLYGKRYVWFIIGWYPNNWYKVNDTSINCTADQLKEALEGHFTTEAVILHQENTVTKSNMVCTNNTVPPGKYFMFLSSADFLESIFFEKLF